ncbi:MAG: response regulator [Candidatus Eremiobacterota bacterium]
MKGKILLIQPSGRVFQMLKSNLENYGFQVLAAHGINEGFQKGRSEKAVIIIMDLSVPEAWHLCNLLRHDKRAKEIPILVLSAKTDKEDMINARRYAVEGYMAKPYDPEAIIKTCEDILKKKRATVKTILLVEDDPAVLHILRLNLQYAGFKVLLAHNALEALEIAEKEKFNMLITDVMMPGMDGLELYMKIRDIPSKEDIPVVLLTANDNFEDISRAYNIGVAEYIVKPFDPVELIERIRRLL